MKFDDPLQAHLGPFGLFLLRATASAAMAIETSALKIPGFFRWLPLSLTVRCNKLAFGAVVEQCTLFHRRG